VILAVVFYLISILEILLLQYNANLLRCECCTTSPKEARGRVKGRCSGDITKNSSQNFLSHLIGN